MRLVADGETRRQALTVAMDPRVASGAPELQALLAFQREVEADLARSAEQHETLRSVQEWLRAAREDPRAGAERGAIGRALAEAERMAAPGVGQPERVNRALASLATDLESVDAAPTGPQRELLASAREAISRFEARWKPFASGALADLERRLTRRGLKPR